LFQLLESELREISPSLMEAVKCNPADAGSPLIMKGCNCL
jgi:hypothetical protein